MFSLIVFEDSLNLTYAAVVHTWNASSSLLAFARSTSLYIAIIWVTDFSSSRGWLSAFFSYSIDSMDTTSELIFKTAVLSLQNGRQFKLQNQTSRDLNRKHRPVEKCWQSQSHSGSWCVGPPCQSKYGRGSLVTGPCCKKPGAKMSVYQRLSPKSHETNPKNHHRRFTANHRTAQPMSQTIWSLMYEMCDHSSKGRV